MDTNLTMGMSMMIESVAKITPKIGPANPDYKQAPKREVPEPTVTPDTPCFIPARIPIEIRCLYYQDEDLISLTMNGTPIRSPQIEAIIRRDYVTCLENHQQAFLLDMEV